MDPCPRFERDVIDPKDDRLGSSNRPPFANIRSMPNSLNPYAAHEQVYQKMKADGVPTWDQRDKPTAIDPHDRRFLEDALAQSWAPGKGRALELGCGTGPLTRWLADRGFETTGVDISATAIEMAKEQSEGSGIEFFQADLCKISPKRLGRFDLILDGHFFHCLTDPKDRAAAFDRVRGMLNLDGVFILMTMCSPIDRSAFARLFPDQIIHRHIIHSPHPTRAVLHWKTLLKELRDHGFEPRLIRFNRCGGEEPLSSLNVGTI